MKQARVYYSELQDRAVIEVPASMFAGHKMTEVADYMDSVLKSETKNLVEILGVSRREERFGKDGSEWIWAIKTTSLSNSWYNSLKALLQSLPRRAQEHFGCAE